MIKSREIILLTRLKRVILSFFFLNKLTFFGGKVQQVTFFIRKLLKFSKTNQLIL